MDLWLILVAFVFGFAANSVRLPPMVGYLIAGFVLHAFGQDSNEAIEFISDVGILLLLFGIGLKLKLNTLAQPVVWAGASIHMAATTVVVATIVFMAGLLGVPLAADVSIVEAAFIGFAFSFSSTVFTIKALEQRNEGKSLQGRNAIGILVVQDIYAVVFLTVAVDTLPSLWAIPVVIAVLGARPLYGWLLERSGHGELLLLFALALSIGVGAEAFDLVGLKADLGALLVGLMLAKHPRAGELADSILDFKDILLIGFFLSIGLDGTPGVWEIGLAAVLLLLLPLKTAGFFALSTRFKFRARTSWHMSVSLATYSEFGLIVGLVGIERGMIHEGWSAILAVVVALSFMLVAPVNSARYSLFDRFCARLTRYERDNIDPLDIILTPGDAEVIIFGMGHVGTGAYDELIQRHNLGVLGVDRSEEGALKQQAAGRNVIRGDALDVEFWERVSLDDPNVKLIVLALNEHRANVLAIKRLRIHLPSVPIAAIARHPDEVEDLREHDVAIARNLYEEAGQGLADDACIVLGLEAP